jgi:hypothetical protein
MWFAEIEDGKKSGCTPKPIHESCLCGSEHPHGPLVTFARFKRSFGTFTLQNPLELDGLCRCRPRNHRQVVALSRLYYSALMGVSEHNGFLRLFLSVFGRFCMSKRSIDLFIGQYLPPHASSINPQYHQYITSTNHEPWLVERR